MFNIRFNLSNLRLVQFSDGFYAIRKGWIFHSYKDLCSGDIIWLGKESIYFRDCCKHNNYEYVLKKYEQLILRDKVIE